MAVLGPTKLISFSTIALSFANKLKLERGPRQTGARLHLPGQVPEGLQVARQGLHSVLSLNVYVLMSFIKP